MRTFFFPERGLRPRPWAVVVAIAGTVGVLAALSDQVQRLEWALDDRMVRVAARDANSPSDLVIVAIDELSFAELQRPWPWPRRMHGALVEALAHGGARTIVFDILFDAPAADPEDDRLFAEAVQRAGNVIFAVDRAETTDQRYAVVQWAEPVDALAAAAAGTGAVSLPLDPDGVVRRASLTVDGRPSLALAAARPSSLRVPSAAPPGTGNRRPTASRARGDTARAPSPDAGAAGDSAGTRLISFRGPPRRTITTVSYYQALDAARLLPRDVFRGKTVFVGRSLQAAAANDQVDYFPTPVGLMAGVEIHARVFGMLARGGRAPADPFAHAGALAALCAGFAAFAGWLGYRTSPLIAGTSIAVAAVAAFVAAYALRAHDLLRLPVIAPLIASGAVFIVGTGYRHALGTRERRMITRAFEHYVAPAIVRQMLDDPSKLSLTGEEYDVTIVFSDLEGFSALSERVPASEVRAHLSRYLTAMTDILLAEHGTLDRFIGDAILGYFGCPVRDPLHPAQACRAVLAMERRMEELNAEWDAAGLPRLRMRLGMNTGRVVAGNMGTATVFHYTIIGDAVNLASRLESVNKMYGTTVLAGEETRRLTADQFAWREIDRVRVRGRATATTISSLIGPAGAISPTASRVAACYAEGLARYRARAWTAAADRFRAALALDPGDGPSHALLARCAGYEAAPPPADWDGVFELTEK